MIQLSNHPSNAFDYEFVCAQLPIGWVPVALYAYFLLVYLFIYLSNTPS